MYIFLTHTHISIFILHPLAVSPPPGRMKCGEVRERVRHVRGAKDSGCWPGPGHSWIGVELFSGPHFALAVLVFSGPWHLKTFAFASWKSKMNTWSTKLTRLTSPLLLFPIESPGSHHHASFSSCTTRELEAQTCYSTRERCFFLQIILHAVVSDQRVWSTASSGRPWWLPVIKFSPISLRQGVDAAAKMYESAMRSKEILSPLCIGRNKTAWVSGFWIFGHKHLVCCEFLAFQVARRNWLRTGFPAE